MSEEQSYVSINEGSVILGVGRSTFNRLRADPAFPKAYRLGGTLLRWKKTDLIDWIETRKEGADEQQKSNP